MPNKSIARVVKMPRRPAGPRDWDKLDACQRTLVSRIVQMIIVRSPRKRRPT